MAHLSVNLNAIAYLRNRRDLPWPSVVEMAQICLENGANGITVHPRPDERHIRRTDVFELEAMLRAEWPGREYNIEGYPDEAFLLLCERAKPDQVTLVPDDPLQVTSDHGWDVARHEDMLEGIAARLKRGGMRVSLFINADPAVPEAAARVGADRVELYTGPYGNPTGRTLEELERLVATAEAGRAAGLGVNAGHDLTLDNLPTLMRAIPDIAECSIGHGVTADALKYGMAETVRRYVAALSVR
jgi:pyridoxine 5-phosphate synthase